MHFAFVLVEPYRPGNVGSAARALKTMGFSDLRLVNPSLPPTEDRALHLGHGSHDILENAKVFDRFEEAVVDLDFLVATTAKPRRVPQEYVASRELVSVLRDKEKTMGKLGVIFGGEESGLSNDHVKACDLVSYVPLEVSYPSLNLAQAVMLYAYELSALQLATWPEEEPEFAYSDDEYRFLKEKVAAIMQNCGLIVGSPVYERYLARLGVMSSSDIHLAHALAKGVLEKIGNS